MTDMILVIVGFTVIILCLQKTPGATGKINHNNHQNHFKIIINENCLLLRQIIRPGIL